MNQHDIEQLYQKYLNGTLNNEERNQWQNLIHDADSVLILQTLMDSNFNHIEEDQLIRLDAQKSQHIFKSIINHQRQKTIPLWKKISAIAAVSALVIFSASLFYSKQLAKQDVVKYDTDLTPGKSGATLTLANGKKIYLAETKSGKLAEETGVDITKNDDGILIYTLTDKSPNKNSINSLTTTKGEQSQIRLPDGSTVYLNAESSLKYPSSFNKQKIRKVELTGEAYFEIAKDKTMPFIVETNNQKVEVLGTHFNVKGYPEELGIKTTLLEGSVRLSTPFKNDVVLSPGEQAFFQNSQVTVKTVQTDYAVAWKEGYFMFNHDRLEDIMHNISRWYNVDVIFEDTALKNLKFFGSISKFENVSKVLGIMQTTHMANFEVKNNHIIISKP